MAMSAERGKVHFLSAADARTTEADVACATGDNGHATDNVVHRRME